ncbi:hypothetical protein HanRHA438_Chr05g0243131 [Helianthus annuus]|uniref:Uncharacterized protein n=1 Tax=Helianthus annuus TaxID=4232 RepID=A0A9K3J216_HELAN|nr:hypothetical protein HanXRQr2_Chr05g0233991 [Helianthus annuus]KAJ0571548.1 hypothetical protein HanHA300_Chr05g0191441 [Helianthus annuus]KAJ0578769.1 hypothetical protein HanIR_Chr05g0251581 [Helianthus annuus]KAJ0585952.1 hypothetical protein HanHA89_Chr05g0206551 [Helianthus annuus]KAJ0920596.1 hypothetical protein HanRHA438_Chr05g0243131 [Helianthus annuus]
MQIFELVCNERCLNLCTLFLYHIRIIILFCLFMQLLNQIVCELPPEHPLSNVRPLRDSLGHTPFQI